MIFCLHKIQWTSIMSWFTDRRDAITKKVTSIKPKISSILGASLGIDIDADIDAAIKVILDDSFLKVIDRAIFALDSVIDKTSQEFKSLVQQISDDLFKLEKKINELIDKFFDNLSDLIQDIKTNLVDPIVDSVFALEEKIFEDINQVIDKVFNFFEGTVQEFKDDLFKLFNPLPNPFDPCRRQYDLGWTPSGRLTSIDLFNLFECHQLKRLDDENTKVKEIQEVYAMLQKQSFRLTCLGRGSPAFQELYMRKWLKYGQLFELWQEFDKNMTPQQAYDEAIRRLNQARNEYQAKVAEIEQAQSTANTAVTKADAAQNTANSGVSKADTAQNTANSAVTKADAAQNTANAAQGKANTAVSKADNVNKEVEKLNGRVVTWNVHSGNQNTHINVGNKFLIAIETDGRPSLWNRGSGNRMLFRFDGDVL